MRLLLRIAIWPLFAVLSFIVFGAFVVATIGGVIEWVRR